MTRFTVAEALARHAPFGTAERDGVVVAAWHVTAATDGAPMVEAAARTPGGGAAAWRRPHLPDGPTPALGPGPSMPHGFLRTPFHAVLRRMDEVGTWGPGAAAAEALVAVVASEAGARARAVRAEVSAHLASRSAALAAFAAAFDQDALEWADANRVPAMVTAHWEGLDSTFEPGAPLRSCLVARPALSATFRHAWAEDPERFRSAMSRGGPDAVAVSALAARLPRFLTTRLPRALDEARGGRWPDVRDGRDDRGTSAHEAWIHDEILGRVSHLASLPADRVPGDGGWKDYLAVSSLVGAIMARQGGADPDLALGVRANDWAGWAARLAAAAGRDPFAAWDDAWDRRSALWEQVLRPALSLAGRAAAAALRGGPAFAGWLLDSGRTVVRWMGDDARWHARLPAIDAAVAALPGAERMDPPWAPVMPDDAWAGLSLRVLVTGAQLVEEGRRDRGLDHCVGGYAGRCREGAMRVASIRRDLPDGTFERISTVAFDMHSVAHDPTGDVVIQHRGMANSDPPPEAVGFLDRYLSRILLAQDGVALADLVPVHADDEEGVECGYDVHVPGNWGRVLAAWSPCLPRRLRALAPSDVARLHAEWDACGRPAWSAAPVAHAPPADATETSS